MEKPNLIMPEDNSKKVKFKSVVAYDGFIVALDERGTLWYGEPEYDDAQEYIGVTWNNVNMPSYSVDS